MPLSAIISVLGGVRASLFAAASLAFMLSTGFLWASNQKLKADKAEITLSIAESSLKSVEFYRQLYSEQAEALAILGEKHAKALASAKQKRDAIIADLRSGAQRLQDHWSCFGEAGTPTTPGEPDANALLRIQGAGDLVQIGAEADAQVRGLQQVIEEYRNERKHVRSGSE